MTDNKPSQDILDIAIIGAGPAGMSAAVNAVARGKSVRIFSGSKTLLYKANVMNNHLGFHNIKGKDMMETFENHVKSLDIEIEEGRVSNIMHYGNQFMLNFAGDVVTAKTVILAIGVAKANPIPGEREFLGKGVSYCATCDGMLFRDKKAVLWGLSDDSVNEANFLNSIDIDVTFIAPKTKPENLHSDITFKKGVVKEIQGKNSVTSIKLFDVSEKKETEMKTDVIFILRNAIAPDNLIPDIKIKDGSVVVDKNMATNIDGLYAAGDCIGPPLQISNAIGDGLVAAQHAAKYIDEVLNKDK